MANKQTNRLYASMLSWITHQRLYITLLLSLLSLASCARSGEKPRGLSITTTIAPAKTLIQEIADSLVSVTTLLPQGNNPENYDPTPQDLQALARSRAYFYMGDLGFERSWIPQIAKLHPELHLVRLDRYVQHQHDHGTGLHDEELHDPHYWSSLSGIRAMGQSITEGLIQLDSTHRADYERGYQRLESDLQRLSQQIKPLLSGQLPSRSFVIYHPSLTDFAHEWGLEQLVVEENGKEPTPAHLQRLLQRAKEQRVRVVFVQREFDTKIIESIARELGARTVTINPLDGDWRGELLRIARALSQEQ